MQQFERHGRMERLLSYRATLAGNQQNEQRAHHLAFAATHILQSPTEEIVLMVKHRVEKTLITRQIFRYGLTNLRENIHKCA